MKRREFLKTIGLAALAVGGCKYDQREPYEGGEAMKKELAGLRWQPRWVSHLGCIKGCLDYLGAEISWPWLYGGTGHAFIINMHKVVCPSGPTAWNTEMLFRLAPNLGYKVAGVFAHKSAPDFAAKQAEAWALVCESLDNNIPCYGWELDIPEYYVVYGYDEVGYYYSGAGCDEGAGPKPWQRHIAEDSGIGVLEMYTVQPCEPAADEKVVKDALTLALEHAENPEKWIYPDYRSGPAGFDLWAEALDNGTAMRVGQGYNGAVWAECRGEGVAFLKEAKERLAGQADALFDEAIVHYSRVHAKLKALAELHPFIMEPEEEQLTSPDGAALVREAGSAERKGLEVLDQLLKSI